MKLIPALTNRSWLTVTEIPSRLGLSSGVTGSTTSMVSSPAADNTLVAVTILSENAAEIALLQHLMALASQPRFDVKVVAASYFDATRAAEVANSDLILLSHDYGNRSFVETVKQLSQSAPSFAPILVLLNQNSISHHVNIMAEAARLGVTQFSLAEELSLNELLRQVGALTNFSNSHDATTGRQRQQPDQLVSTNQRTLTTNQTAPTNQAAAQTKTTMPAATQPFPQGARQQDQARETNTQIQPAERLFHQPHQLSIDLEHRRIHLGLRAESMLGYESSGVFSFDEWLQLLDPTGVSHFNQLLASCSSGQPNPPAIHCLIRSLDSTKYPVEITEVQLVDNNQGEIVGANAQLYIGEAGSAPPSMDPERSEIVQGALSAPSVSTSNTQNSAAVSSSTDWPNVSRSLPLSCLLLDEAGIVVEVIQGDQVTAQAFPEAKVGQAISDVLGIESADNYVSVIAKTLNTGKPHQQTLNFLTPQGMRWYESYITQLKGNPGLSRRVVWSAFDITPARHAYQELLKNHDALTDMLNDAPLMFCQKDAAGRYQRVNQAFCETYNVRAEIIAGRKDQEVFSGKLLEEMTQADEDVATQGGETYYVTHSTVNGQARTTHWHKFALTSHSSNTVESITVFGFVTMDAQTKDQNQAEADAGSATDTAAPGLAGATGAVGQDFKMIISSIANYTEMAMSQRNKGRRQRLVEYLNQVVNASERARDLIADAGQQGSKTGNRQAVALKPLVKEIVQMLQPTLPTSLNFQTDLENAQGSAEIDPVQFQRIVMQLLVSARDSADPNDAISLKLSNIHFDDERCVACDEKMRGDYFSLTVESSSGDISQDGLKKMVGAAAKSLDQQSKGNENSNIIFLAHQSDGHVMIDLLENTIALQLLFKSVTDSGPSNSSPSGSEADTSSKRNTGELEAPSS